MLDDSITYQFVVWHFFFFLSFCNAYYNLILLYQLRRNHHWFIFSTSFLDLEHLFRHFLTTHRVYCFLIRLR
uniref:Putative secreted peptide n=1 Tax=Anopheles braziliensis TaxID=58242 RepID=A0A2M3ZXE1_9DIPT